MEEIEIADDKKSPSDMNSRSKMSEDGGHIKQPNEEDEQMETDETEMGNSKEDEEIHGRWHFSKSWSISAGKESKLNLASYNLARTILNGALTAFIMNMGDTTCVDYAAIYVNEVKCDRNKVAGAIHFSPKN